MRHFAKPLGQKNYGSIPHLPGSRTGPEDHTCHIGQARIATVKVRDQYDEIIAQEKLDGSNVGVALIEGALYPLGRAGYLASTSPYKMHHLFADWVWQNQDRFLAVLQEGEHLVGEWMAQAHGTIYDWVGDPFVPFDLMSGTTRTPYDEFLDRVQAGDFQTPAMIHRGDPLSIDDGLALLGTYGFHGATEPAEGLVWRVERERLIARGKRVRIVDFLVKYVRPDKIDGKYLHGDPVWNWLPQEEQ